MENKVCLKDTELYVLRILKEQELQLMKALSLARASMKDTLESYAARVGLEDGDLSVVEDGDKYFLVSQPKGVESRVRNG